MPWWDRLTDRWPCWRANSGLSDNFVLVKHRVAVKLAGQCINLTLDRGAFGFDNVEQGVRVIHDWLIATTEYDTHRFKDYFRSSFTKWIRDLAKQFTCTGGSIRALETSRQTSGWCPLPGTRTCVGGFSCAGAAPCRGSWIWHSGRRDDRQLLRNLAQRPIAQFGGDNNQRTIRRFPESPPQCKGSN